MTKYPTDEELAAAVEKITTAVREVIADFKAAAPSLVQSLSDGEMDKTQSRRRSPPGGTRSRARGLTRGRCAASRAHENRGRPGISPSWERQTAREYRTYTPAMHRLARALDRQRGRAMTDAEKKQS